MNDRVARLEARVEELARAVEALAGLTGALLAVAWRRDLRAVAWLAAPAGAANLTRRPASRAPAARGSIGRGWTWKRRSTP